MNLLQKIALLLILISSSGCVLTQEKKDIVEGPLEKVFFAKYEQVWRAAQLALARYPMRVNNMDTGLLETDLIGGANAWTPPGGKDRIPNAQHYTIRMQVIRGRSQRSKAVKVLVEKVIRLKSSFFSDAKELPSDGLEERVILYRTGRILTIEKAIEAVLADKESNEEY